MYITSMCECDEKLLREVFNAFDTDNSGTIDAKELKAVIKAYYDSVGEAADDKHVTDSATASIAVCCYT